MLTVIQYYIIIKIKKTKASRKDLKKEGIMRINSYNKFFAKVAEIMNTSIKAVKQLDGRYKVELANHVYLNVYRGVGGSLFIHDYRGIAHITSCYDFEDFKTMKDLYERLVSDYSESTKKEVMEVNQELNTRFGKEQQYFDTDSLQPNKKIIAKIEISIIVLIKTHAVLFHLMYIVIITINQMLALKHIRILFMIANRCINK